MLIYVLLLILVIIILLVRYSILYKDRMFRTIIFYVIMLLLLYIYVFRFDTVGKDYSMYHSFFYISNDVLSSRFIEPGYLLLNLIAQHYNNFLIISLFVFIIHLVGLTTLIDVFNINRFSFIYFFIITYMYFFSFNVIRQYLAIGIISFGIALFFYYYEHNILKYLLFVLSVLLAKEFHSTASFCLVFLIFPHLYLTKKKVIISGMVTTMFFFTNIIKLGFIKLLMFFPNYIQKYGNSDALTTFGSKGIIQFIPVILQFIFLYMYIDKNNIKNYKKKFILSGYILFLILYSGGGNAIVDRLQTYTYIFPILFSCIFIDNKNISNLCKILFIGFWILYYLLRLLTNNSGIIPYMFI